MNAIQTEKAPAAIGPYSQAIDSGARIVFVSGQLPIDPATGAFPEGGIQEQTRQSLTNAKAILEAAGLGLGNVVKTTVFLADMADFAAMNEVYAQFFAAPFPARSAVAVKALPKGALVEIECIAARGGMETGRIRLRPWRESDAETLFKYASDPEVGPRAGWPPHKSVEESLEIIRTVFNNDRTWAIELKETGEPIGCIGYFIHGESNIDIGENDVEAGYWVARPYWNRGICTEALRLMINHCFNEKGYCAIWSDFFLDNPASGRVMEKCNFRDTGRINLCSRLQVGSDRPVKVMKRDQ